MTDKKEFDISLETLHTQISALQKGLNLLRKTGINDDLLYIALQRCAQRHYSDRYNKTISIKIIRAVVSGIGDLGEYIFPSEEENG